MKLFMAVTADDLELPLCVADSYADLVKFTGRPISHVATLLSRGTTTLKGYKLVRVEIDDEDQGGGI